jgi:hypothetical protein
MPAFDTAPYIQYQKVQGAASSEACAGRCAVPPAVAVRVPAKVIEASVPSRSAGTMRL